MVRPMSSASAPISIASAASEMRSPALGPTMPQPMRRWLSSSHKVLVRPSSRPSESDRPLAAQGKTALPYLTPFALASVSVTPAQATSGRCRRPRVSPWRQRGFVSARHFRRDLALMRRLVRQHRLADDIPDGEDMRHITAQLLVDRDIAALVDSDACGSGVERAPFGTRPTATST